MWSDLVPAKRRLNSLAALASARRGLSEELVARHLGAQERARVDAGEPAQEAEQLPSQADADVGRTSPGSTSTTSTTTSSRRRTRARRWDDVPADIKNTFDRLGIPEAEKKYLAGVGAQYESEVVYHSLREEWTKKGVIFLDMDSGLREHPDIVKEYFGTVIPPEDNKFAALNSAVWSGGSFVYVPTGVHVEIPLQAYFRINAENMGQFERTLIIVDEGSYVHYVEGCTAPTYSSDSLHSAVVEIIVKEGARFRYTTIQNWSKNVYNLVTKRAVAYRDATMEWVDGNLGSQADDEVPGDLPDGAERAKAEMLSIAFAGAGQHQDAGGKVIHAAPHTSSSIVVQVDREDGGRAGYRGLLKVAGGRTGRKSTVGCDALILDDQPLRHLPDDGDRRGRRRGRPRGDGLEGLARAALLPDEPRHQPGRGDGDDRPRLHRADLTGAADGVQRRAEPADPARDGGGGRLMSVLSRGG